MKATFTPPLKDEEFQLLEDPRRSLSEVEERVRDGTFYDVYCDARIHGSTFLPENKNGKGKKGANGESESALFQQNRRTGAVQFGFGLSVAPVRILRATLTKMAAIQEDKERGMAPLGARVVEHAVFTQPFFVDPSAAAASFCSRTDLDLFLKLIPHMYSATRATQRNEIQILHAWYFEFKDILGCGELEIINSLRPTKLENPEVPSHSLSEYVIPTPDNPVARRYMDRLARFTDLITGENWIK